jgi:hypothetical protein
VAPSRSTSGGHHAYGVNLGDTGGQPLAGECFGLLRLITDDTAGTSGDNPHPPDLFAQLAGMLAVALRVTLEPDLDVVAIDLRIRTGARRTQGLIQLLLAPEDALDLAARLAGSVERWRAKQAQEQEGHV